MAVSLARKLWSIEEYELMIEKGVLNENTRVELIRGEIIKMAPIGLRHAACVVRLDDLFHELLGRTVIVSVQKPVQLHNDSEPEPDVALLKRRSDAYASKRPTASDVLLLVEVADTTLTTDRSVKVPLYAEAGIATVWLVNFDKTAIEVYSNPVAGTYQQATIVGQDEMLVLPGELQGTISVAEVFGQ